MVAPLAGHIHYHFYQYTLIYPFSFHYPTHYYNHGEIKKRKVWKGTTPGWSKKNLLSYIGPFYTIRKASESLMCVSTVKRGRILTDALFTLQNEKGCSRWISFGHSVIYNIHGTGAVNNTTILTSFSCPALFYVWVRDRRFAAFCKIDYLQTDFSLNSKSSSATAEYKCPM